MVSLLIVLCVLGVIAWAIDKYVPMEGGIKQLVMLVIFIVALVFVLNAFGVCDTIKAQPVPRV
jgi:hypothetical protein